MILAEKKIPDAVYFHNYMGYNTLCSKATVTMAGGSQEGVVIVLQEKP